MARLAGLGVSFQDACGTTGHDVIVAHDQGTPDLLGSEMTAALIESYIQQFEMTVSMLIELSLFA